MATQPFSSFVFIVFDPDVLVKIQAALKEYTLTKRINNNYFLQI